MTSLFGPLQTSLVKLAICQYALDEYADAHANLEGALNYARRSAPTIEDRIQIAEILNNLGCLGYMCGNPLEAKAYFRESLDVQFAVMSESLYSGPSHTMHSVSLNISITRANIGFLKLVTKDLTVAITALEAALMVRSICGLCHTNKRIWASTQLIVFVYFRNNNYCYEGLMRP